VQENSPKIEDIGMLRNWNINDTTYLKTPIARDFVFQDIAGKLNITVKPDYIAPKDLFKSSRDLGTNATLNKLLNLTWEFPVNPGFYYMIRLHLCELDPNITSAGDRVFTVYLQGNVAEEQVDVMKWTQNQKGLAVQRNYAVLIPKSESNSNKKVNLKIQMHSYGNGDPFLNGLEIFKISDVGSKNLAGPNPDPVKEKSSKISGTTKIILKMHTTIIIEIIVIYILYIK